MNSVAEFILNINRRFINIYLNSIVQIIHLPQFPSSYVQFSESHTEYQPN